MDKTIILESVFNVIKESVDDNWEGIYKNENDKYVGFIDGAISLAGNLLVNLDSKNEKRDDR